jgi:uncharacterized protein (TIGR03435 family)
MTFRALTAVAFVFITSGRFLLRAQETDAVKMSLAFEVATVKEINQHKITVIDLHVYPGGHLVIHAHRLAMLIAEAFNIPEEEIVGGDESVVQAWFDVEGKPSEEIQAEMSGSESSESGIRDARVRLMLQSLLIERFHLKFHIDSRPGTVYQLRRGDGPMRLKPAELKADTPADHETVTSERSDWTGVMVMTGGQHFEIRQTSMLQLTHSLANVRRTPVIDQTGLPGFYNFTSKTVVSNEDIDNGGSVSILVDALPEMGLKLVKADGLVEKFVIDSVQQTTAN